MTEPEWALGFTFDIVLRGSHAHADGAIELAVVTPFQTVGPFFDFGLELETGEVVATAAAQGRQIVVEGSLRDGAGAPVSDAIVEVWQANAAGRYRHPADDRDVPLDPACDGFGRVATTADGRFTFLDRHAWTRRRAGRPSAGAAPARQRPGPRDSHAAGNPDLFRERARERRRSHSRARARESTRDARSRASQARTGTCSTSCCRDPARPYSSSVERRSGPA